MSPIRFVDDVLRPQPADAAAAAERDDEALDAYSRVVTGVAQRLAPSVASVRVSRRGRGGAGSRWWRSSTAARPIAPACAPKT